MRSMVCAMPVRQTALHVQFGRQRAASARWLKAPEILINLVRCGQMRGIARTQGLFRLSAAIELISPPRGVVTPRFAVACSPPASAFEAPHLLTETLTDCKLG